MSTVRACEQGIDFGVGEEADDGPVGAFGWDREHPLDEPGVLGAEQRGVGEERTQRGQA
jgi:hypothetical protein